MLVLVVVAFVTVVLEVFSIGAVLPFRTVVQYILRTVEGKLENGAPKIRSRRLRVLNMDV